MIDPDYDPILTPKDVQRTFCIPGMRKWARAHGVDLKRFIEEGMPASELYGRGDDLTIETMVKAKRDAEDGR